MAKAKKSSVSTSKKKSAGPTKPAASGGTPLVDTNLAAQSAAKMLLRKSNADFATPVKESGAFKDLKASLNQSHRTALDNAIGSTAPQRSDLPHMQSRQTGRNQTFGADVNRVGVPRRTPG